MDVVHYIVYIFRWSEPVDWTAELDRARREEGELRTGQGEIECEMCDVNCGGNVKWCHTGKLSSDERKCDKWKGLYKEKHRK